MWWSVALRLHLRLQPPSYVATERGWTLATASIKPATGNTGTIHKSIYGPPTQRTCLGMTYDKKSDFTALACNSRLRGVHTFVNSYSEFTQKRFTGYLEDISSLTVPSYGSVPGVGSKRSKV